MNVGQAEVTAGVAVGQPRVIQAQQMEYGRVQFLRVLVSLWLTLRNKPSVISLCSCASPSS
jgi:hypothetical protein